MGQRRFLLLAVALTLGFLTWQLFWAFLTPPFRSPDEPLHLNSVLRVATEGSWPAPGQARVDAQVMASVKESGLIVPEAQAFDGASRTNFHEGTDRYFGQFPVAPHSERTVVKFGSEPPTELADQMTQHPPLYYAAAAGVFRSAGALDWPWDRQLLLLRVFSILLTLPTVPSLMYVLRRIGVERGWTISAATIIMAVPQFVFIGSSASNDALAIGSGALTLAGCAAAMYGSGSWRAVFGTGLPLGLALWSKGTAIPLGVVVALSFLVNSRIPTIRQKLLRGFAAGSLGLAVGGAWWIRNFLLYGRIQPNGFSYSQGGHPGDNLGYFLRSFGFGLSDSFWGKFGWLEVPLPVVLLRVLALLGFICVGVAIWRGPHRRSLANFTAYPALVLGVIAIEVWRVYQIYGYTPGSQGRYLFPGLVGILAVIVWAWLPLFARVGTRWMWTASWLKILPASSFIALGTWSATIWARACYPVTNPHTMQFLGIDLERWAVVAGVTMVTLKLVIVIGGMAILVMVICLLLSRKDFPVALQRSSPLPRHEVA